MYLGVFPFPERGALPAGSAGISRRENLRLLAGPLPAVEELAGPALRSLPQPRPRRRRFWPDRCRPAGTGDFGVCRSRRAARTAFAILWPGTCWSSSPCASGLALPASSRRRLSGWGGDHDVGHHVVVADAARFDHRDVGRVEDVAVGVVALELHQVHRVALRGSPLAARPEPSGGSWPPDGAPGRRRAWWRWRLTKTTRTQANRTVGARGAAPAGARAAAGDRQPRPAPAVPIPARRPDP